VVPVSGIRDGKALAAATGQLAGVYWQDKRAQWSDLFSRYRLWLGALLLLGMALCAGVLWHKLGLGAAARIMAGNALALLLAAAVLGWCGQPFTLFALLAMSWCLGLVSITASSLPIAPPIFRIRRVDKSPCSLPCWRWCWPISPPSWHSACWP